MEWNNMEIAPKDGTRILLKDAEGVYVAAWLNDAVGRYSRKIMCWCIPESWQDEQGGYYTIDEPVGWMHCPK